MPRITSSDCWTPRNSRKAHECHVQDCERHYCIEHRILWRDCDTAILTFDGAGQSFYEMRECPACIEDERKKKWEDL